MQKKIKTIPVNMKADSFGTGMVIGRSVFKSAHPFKEVERAHRDDYHLFILQESGTTPIEIDFQKYKVKASTVLYIHPTQVHRVGMIKNTSFISWAIDNEALHPESLKLLEEITPSKPLLLTKDAFKTISEAASLGITLFERTHEKLYHTLLKNTCNVLVTLVASQYLSQSKSKDKSSRFEIISQSFKSALELNYKTIKSPGEYADQLHISTPYLNECIKNTSGYSVSYHIQQRNILEAKRLLYHTDKSIKEIATELGYNDHSYFIRLFVKVAGVTPLSFRNKNRD